MKARKLLQVYLEKKFKDDSKIELNGENLRKAAFEIHSKAYWDAKIQSLPITDLIIIGFTPDITEWLDEGTRCQAKDITGKLVDFWKTEFDKAVSDRIQEVTDYFKDILGDK